MYYMYMYLYTCLQYWEFAVQWWAVLYDCREHGTGRQTLERVNEKETPSDIEISTTCTVSQWHSMMGPMPGLVRCDGVTV